MIATSKDDPKSTTTKISTTKDDPKLTGTKTNKE